MDYIKINDDMVSSFEPDEIVDKLEDKVKEEFNTLVSEYKARLIENMIGCETPIERLLALHLNDSLNSLQEELNIVFYIDNQGEIVCGENEYRADFIINIGMIDVEKNISFIIECNGHDFHEKTKEQVIKDNQRQRNMIKEGCIVLNFSGSEIYKNAAVCVAEIKGIIRAYCKEQLNK